MLEQEKIVKFVRERRGGQTWTLLPERQSHHHQVGEEQEGHRGGQAGEDPPGGGPQVRVGVGGVGQDGHRHEEDAASQRDEALLDTKYEQSVS